MVVFCGFVMLLFIVEFQQQREIELLICWSVNLKLKVYRIDVVIYFFYLYFILLSENIYIFVYCNNDVIFIMKVEIFIRVDRFCGN